MKRDADVSLSNPRPAPESSNADKKIKASINRKRERIRAKLLTIMQKHAFLLHLDDPRHDKVHKNHNQDVSNLVQQLQDLSKTEEHQKYFRDVIAELNLQSYCRKDEYGLPY